MAIYQIPDELWFPDLSEAEEDGLLGIGGDLSSQRLLLAYKSGIFPWFSEGQPILWWSPDPRFVLFPEKLRVSKSMKQVLRKGEFEVTFNKDFEHVISNCKTIGRKGQEGTWITQEMKDAYLDLHKKGIAKSVEVWQDGLLVGGIYGVDLGGVFCGESMFTKVSNASKFAFIKFVEKFKSAGGKLIDCQVYTQHLESLGAEMISRKKYQEYLL